MSKHTGDAVMCLFGGPLIGAIGGIMLAAVFSWSYIAGFIVAALPTWFVLTILREVYTHNSNTFDEMTAILRVGTYLAMLTAFLAVPYLLVFKP